jgi:uracil-DNA glycosylase
MHPPLTVRVHPTWLPTLESELDTLLELNDFLESETAAGRLWNPKSTRVLRAFEKPLPEIKVLILGQDPYPTRGHAVGLSFSVNPEVSPLPRSLANIYKELTADVECAAPSNGDLTPWTNQGVMLLNRVLTVGNAMPGSHRGKGWERITEAAIRALVNRDQPLVAILWGKDAQSVTHLLPDIPIIASPHPSPMSARHGFWGSRPFSQANAFLKERGVQPIDWALPS